jgi:hypothetical protein
MNILVKFIKRLLRERREVLAHNKYLARVNADLTARDSRARMSEQTLRWRIHDLERALNNVGTENE